MQNAFHEPQTILLLGGTSDIGRAIVRELVTPAARTVILGCRRPEHGAPEELAHPGLEVVVAPFDASRPSEHEAFVDDIVAVHGDIDVAIVAFGVLGSQVEFDADPVAAADAVAVNYVGAVSATLAVAARMRRQGHGEIVVLSSVAGERARAANFVYGSSKAGLDAFAQGLGDSLQGTGVHVIVVRPGFVRSRMTEGMPPAPFETTPDEVARRTVAGMRAGRHTVWVPPILRVVFTVLRHVPRPIFRRLPLR